MEVSVENTSQLGRKMTVQLPAEEVDAKVEGRIKEMGQHVRLKGFRPGRVPFKVLRQRFGRQVRQEVVGELIQESFQRAVSEQNLRPASSPEISAEDDQSAGGLQYTASFEVIPELDSLDLSRLEIERPVAEVTEGDIDGMIQTLREQRRTWMDKEAAAEEGDLVFFRYQAELEDGRFPEDEADARAGAVLGHGAFDLNFEKALVGARVGDEKEFEVIFTDEARESDLAGRAATVSASVEKVQKSELPAVDEEFMASFGVTEGGLDQFRQEVRQNLERELKDAIARNLRQTVIGALVDQFDDLQVPAAMVENEIQSLRQQASAQLQQVGRDASQVPDEEAFRDQARQRVRGGLLVAEVARHAQLEVDMGRVRDRVNEIASTYEDPQAVVNLYYQREDLLGSIQNLVMEQQAVEWVLEQARVTEVKRSFDEIMNRASQDADTAA